ncbi:MAG TPA: hypothetical protein PLS79_23405, partial [Caldilinea sp.]|nr:hypothetical protein [Caldilinea sp.]
ARITVGHRLSRAFSASRERRIVGLRVAGDWIKMRGNLWDDPRVSRLVDMTDSSEAAVIGALYWLWATADQHTEDGIMPGLTTKAIDRKTGLQGFGNALIVIGWLADHPDGVRIIKFEEHNGASAKSRCQTAKRVSTHKANAKVTQAPLPEQHDTVTTALPREEKRREEKDSKTDSESAQAQTSPPPAFRGEVNEAEIHPKAKVLIAADWELPEGWGVDAENLGWPANDILREAEKFRQFYTVGKGGGTRRGLKGWRQSWSNWLSNAEKFAPIRRVS